MNKLEHTSILITTEKSFYYPGDTVSGHILMNFESTDFPGNQLILKVKGKEETSWEAPNPQNPNVKNKKTGLIIFYNHKFPLNVWNEGYVPAGQYDFPFSFILKDFLPGSYTHLPDNEDIRTRTCALISYKIKAECHSMDNGKEMSKIKYTKELILREKLKVNIFSKGEFMLPLSSCFCIGQGVCQIRCYFEKNAYESGENANIFCEIDNSNGSQDIQNIYFVLKNKILLRSDDGINKEYIRTIFRKESDGLAAHQKAEGIMKKTISCKFSHRQENLEEIKNNDENDAFRLQESSSGQLVNSHYVLEVMAKSSGFLTCGSDAKAQIPVTIYKKINKQKEMDWEWNPKVMEVKAIVLQEGNFYRRSNKNK